MKPIEPGCLALYSSAITNLNKPITCTVKVVDGPLNLGFCECEVCGKRDMDWEVSGLPSPYDACCECCLTRIDGGDPDAIDITADREVMV